MDMKPELKTYRSPALGCLIGSANQVLLGELEKALRKAGLPITASEYLVLRALYYKDGIQQCEIAEMVGRNKSGICRCVAALVKKGFVRVESVSHKCLRVYLTGKALSIEERVMTVATERHKALSGLVTPEELVVFNKVLESIISLTE